MGEPGVLLDRDGTIIEHVEYLDDPERLRLLPGAGAGIRLLNRAGVPVALVTNQAGIARGYFDEDRLAAIHARLGAELARERAWLDRVYYCPHHPTAGSGPYSVACDCRKPGTALLERAAADLGLDLRTSYMLGDSAGDLAAARAAGCVAVLVRTGLGAATERELDAGLPAPDFVASNLLEAARWIFLQIGSFRLRARHAQPA